MDFLELAKNRYTTKKYDSSKKVSEENIQKLKEILRLSPSSINSQPWEFIFISEESLKSQLSQASEFNESKIKECSHLIVFTALNNIKKFEKDILAYLPEGNIEIKSWFQKQVYLSLGFFMSACASLGIESTPMEGIDNKKYDEILKLEDYSTLFAVAIGYRDPNYTNQPSITPKSRLDINTVIKTK